MAPQVSDYTTLDQYLVSLVEYSQQFDRADDLLRDLGLTVASVLDGVRQIDQERGYPAAETSEYSGVLSLPKARYWVTVWWAHGLEPHQLAVLAGRDPGQHAQLCEEIERYLKSRTVSLDERSVLKMHNAGMTPLEISRRMGWIRQTIHETLVRLGEEPHATQKRVADEVRMRVIGMRNDGADYPAIRKATGLTTNQVRSVLRHAARQGLVRNYGMSEDGSAERKAGMGGFR